MATSTNNTRTFSYYWKGYYAYSERQMDEIIWEELSKQNKWPSLGDYEGAWDDVQKLEGDK